MSRISVIVPSYNDAELLHGCLEAIAAQSRPADEVIVVDNASEDNTADVAIAAGARVVHEARRGILSATSAGFDAATGDLLLRLDADSVPPVDWIARVAEAFESDPDLDALSGPGDYYGSSRLVHWVAEHVYIGAYSRIVGALLGHPVLFGSNLALSASAWHDVRSRVHRETREVHDDFDIAINLTPGSRIRFDPTLRVAVSARPFATVSGIARRFDWAFKTMAINHHDESLWRRRRQWVAANRAHAAADSGRG
jgi:glycosyltransferase involved in cell wall biosynthesis